MNVVDCLNSCFITALLLLMTVTVGWAAAPQLSLITDGEPNLVVAEGLTPGGVAVLFSVSKERRSWTTRVVPRHMIGSDTDGDGAIELSIKGKIPLQSVWIVVDLTTGEHGVVVPDGFPLKEVDLPATGFLQGNGNLVRTLSDNRGDVEMLLVRPGEGAWVLSASDGGINDEDGVSNGAIQAPFSRMQSVSAEGSFGQAPTHLTQGDVVVGIDPISLEIHTTRFPREAQ